MLKRHNSWPGAASFSLSFVAVLAMSVAPAFAQQQNGCQAALQQVQQQRSQIILQHTNAEQTMATDRRNALLECQKQGIGGGTAANDAVSRCQKNINDTYDASAIDLQIAYNDALNQEQIVENDVMQQNCRWTPEEISQFVATVGQAASQLAQSAAQIISAAKGKAAAATAPAPGTKPAASPAPNPPASGVPSPSKPQPPASPKPPTTKPPASGSSGSSSGSSNGGTGPTTP